MNITNSNINFLNTINISGNNGFFNNINIISGFVNNINITNSNINFLNVNILTGNNIFINNISGNNLNINNITSSMFSVDVTNQRVSYGNFINGLGEFYSPEARGILLDKFGNIRFKATGANSNTFNILSTAGSSLFSVDNNISIGGTQVKTFNNILDDGNGRSTFNNMNIISGFINRINITNSNINFLNCSVITATNAFINNLTFVSTGNNLTYTNISGVNLRTMNITASSGYFNSLNLNNNSNIGVVLSVSTSTTGSWNLVLPSNSGSQYQYLQNFGPNITNWGNGSTKILVYGNRIRGQTNNVLSTGMIERSEVYFGNSYLSGNPNSDNLYWDNFTVPTGYTGCYSFEFGGWRCGQGNGFTQMTVTRNSTIIYNQVKTISYSDCAVYMIKIFWNQFIQGDIVSFKLNENNSASTITSITDTSTINYAPIIITWINQFN